jgi:hypothetical protein
MPDSPRAPNPVVYQLRVVLRSISPLICRCLLIRSDSTVADLHRTLQIAFGWSDEHLHRFVIQGRLCDTDSVFDSRRIRLADLGLRLRERFLYEYDFFDSWQHDVQLEQVMPLARPRYSGVHRRPTGGTPRKGLRWAMGIFRAQATLPDGQHRQPPA